MRTETPIKLCKVPAPWSAVAEQIPLIKASWEWRSSDQTKLTFLNILRRRLGEQGYSI